MATTFARKAAGEILDRVLTRVAEAVLTDAKRRELGEFISPAGLSPGQSLALLRQLTKNLHRLQVGTIDSFFAQVARSFSLELGISPAWEICDEVDDEALRDEAIEAVLAGNPRSELVRLVHLLAKGEARRGVGQLLRDTVDNLYELYQDTNPQAWSQLPRYTPLADAEFDAAIAALEAAPLADKRQINARDEDVARAAAADWPAFIKKGLAGRVASGDNTYYRKPIEPAVVSLLEQLIDHAKAVLVGKAASQTEGSFRWLEKFHGEYQRLKLRQRAMRFDDVTRAVGRLAEADTVDRFSFRLDGQIDHLLLDEFQDTSPAQWRAVRPFARRVAGESAGKSFYCVGDMKQAIYGWRGGVAEIFDAVGGELGIADSRPLNKSYRSSPVIIETVNCVFTNLTRHPHLGRSESAVTAWEKKFPRHQTAKTQLPGYACLRAGPAGDSKAAQADAMFAWTADYLANLVRQSPGCSIGVLTRTNPAIAKLIFALRQRGVAASEEGGNPLVDSAAVRTILSLLQLADHPGDTVARFHLAHSPLAADLEIADQEDHAAAFRISRHVRRSLIHEGYGATIYHWAGRLAPACSRRELSRLRQLVELGYSYGRRATLRPADFVRFAQRQKVADPAAANVRVMTIHKSKGLEFDIVLLPELNAGLTGQPPAFVVHREHPAAPVDRVCQYVNADLQQLLPPRFQAMFDDHTRRVVTESLCVLYVALTRAAHALHMIVPPSAAGEKQPSQTTGGLLRAALAGDGRAEAESLLWESGDPNWHTQCDRESPDVSAADQSATSKPVEIRLAQRQGHCRELERVAPSRLHHGKRLKVGSLFDEDNSGEGRRRGTLMHAWLEQIEWLEEGRPPESVLRRVAALTEGASHINDVLAEFNKALKRGETPRVLTRACYASPLALPLSANILDELQSRPLTLQVRREYPFAYREDARLWQGSIDRLVLLYHGSQLVAADVIDFKTDAKVADAAQRHHEQLAAYQGAVTRIFKLSPQRIAVRLLMLTDGSLVNLSSPEVA